MSITANRVAVVVGTMMCCVVGGPASSAEMKSVDQFTCKDIMREGGSQRDASIAFLHGYLLGKSGASKFDLDALTKQTDVFINRCLDNPNEPAVKAMQQAKS